MNEERIETGLRQLLEVDDRRLLEIVDRATGNSGPAGRPLPLRWAAAAVAALVLAAGAIAFLGGDDPETQVPAEPEGPPFREAIVLARVPGLAAEMAMDDDPSRLGLLIGQSDLAVLGTVRALTEETVSFGVEEVLLGRAELLRGDLPRREGAAPFACAAALRWTEGERVLLFLHRDFETRRLHVTFGGSGKMQVPVDGVFDRADVRAFFRDRGLPAASVARAVSRLGPRALAMAYWHAQDLHGATVPVDDERVQAALRDWAKGLPDIQAPDHWDVLAFSRFVAPEIARGLSRPIRDRLLEIRPGIVGGLNSWWNDLRVLRPLVLAGDERAHDLLDARIREEEERIAESGHETEPRREIADAYRLLATHSPEEALRRAVALARAQRAYRTPAKGFLLEIVHGLSPEAGEREVLEYARSQRAADDSPGLAPLLLLDSPAAKELLRSQLAAPRFRIAPFGAGREAWRAIERSRRPGRLDAIADLVRAELERESGDLDDWTCWLHLWLADGRDPTPFLDRAAAWLRDGDAPRRSRLSLAELLEDALDRRILPFREPTDEEIEAAADAVIR